LEKVCETLTQGRGYIFCWIGIEENTRRVRIPVARSGQENGYLETETITWNGIRKKARRPSISLSTGWATWKPQENSNWQDILKESNMKIYQDKIRKKMFASRKYNDNEAKRPL